MPSEFARRFLLFSPNINMEAQAELGNNPTFTLPRIVFDLPSMRQVINPIGAETDIVRREIAAEVNMNLRNLGAPVSSGAGRPVSGNFGFNIPTVRPSTAYQGTTLLTGNPLAGGLASGVAMVWNRLFGGNRIGAGSDRAMTGGMSPYHGPSTTPVGDALANSTFVNREEYQADALTPRGFGTYRSDTARGFVTGLMDRQGAESMASSLEREWHSRQFPVEGRRATATSPPVFNQR